MARDRPFRREPRADRVEPLAGLHRPGDAV